MRRWVSGAVACLFISAEVVVGLPARVILLRHAEKPPDEADVHLSERGQARAQALAGLLTTNVTLIPKGSPEALFAPSVRRSGHTSRPYETLEPLGLKVKLPIQTPYAVGDYTRLAKFILSDPSLDGKTVVICWIHDDLPDLAAAFGVQPKPARWKETVYDRVWLITFPGNQPSMKDIPQQLLTGDSVE